MAKEQEEKAEGTVMEGGQPSFLDYALDEVPELRTVPGGQEYRLRVASAKLKESKGEKTAGQSLLMFYFDVVDEADTKLITYPVMLPAENLDEEANNDRRRQLKRIMQALGWDLSQGFNVEELKDMECFALLGVETTAEYGEQNKIQNFILPK